MIRAIMRRRLKRVLTSAVCDVAVCTALSQTPLLYHRSSDLLLICLRRSADLCSRIWLNPEFYLKKSDCGNRNTVRHSEEFHSHL